MKIYVTNSYRNGNTHTLGLSYKKARATMYGKSHYYYRGGKYFHETFEYDIDKKVDVVYVIYMYNDIDKKNYCLDKGDDYILEIFSDRKKALIRFDELKQLEIILRLLNMKLIERNIQNMLLICIIQE